LWRRQRLGTGGTHGSAAEVCFAGAGAGARTRTRTRMTRTRAHHAHARALSGAGACAGCDTHRCLLPLVRFSCE
jgi:hypothetical protein